MNYSVSDTAEYGGYLSGPRVIDAGTKDRMRQILAEIQDGRFAREWIAEYRAGNPNYRALKQADLEHPIEAVGRKLRAAMPWLQSAADRGEPRAMYVLGIAAYNGDYAPKDWVRAYALITRAAASGLPQATASLATMNQTIPLAQRQMGVSLASELDQKAADARGRELAAADLGGQGMPVRPAPTPSAPPAPAPSGAIEKVDLPASAPSTPVAAYLPPPFEPAPPPKAAPNPPAPKLAVPKPAAPKPAPAFNSGAYRIQLGAFGVKANADALWARVRTRSEIAGHARQDLPGTVTRLLATGYSQDGASRACAALKAGGLACLVVAP